MSQVTLASPLLTPSATYPPQVVSPEAPSAVSASDAQAAAAAVLPAREAEPFRFFALPPEIRNMVYEEVASTTRRHVLPVNDPNGNPRWTASNDADQVITMVRPAQFPALLATCKEINVEASGIFEKWRYAPVKFFLGYGAASIITPQPPSESADSSLIHCLNVKKSRWHKPSDSEEMTDFNARSASYIEHCQAVTGKADVQLIVDTPDLHSGVHDSNEIVKTVEGAWSLGMSWSLPNGVELGIELFYHKQFSDSRFNEEDAMDSDFLEGKRLERNLRQNYAKTSPNFRFQRLMSEEKWAEIMKGKE